MARDDGEQQAMTRERLRQALDDSVLTHTGRSIGDLASQRVIDDIWPLIQAREAALLAFAWRIANNHEHKWRGDHCKYCNVELSSWTAQAQKQARALLASMAGAEADEKASDA